jgi:hypothetical protein
MPRLRLSVRHMTIGVAISAMIFALWDAQLEFRRACWLSLARVHAEKEEASLEGAANPRNAGMVPAPLSTGETWKRRARYHQGLKRRYEYLATHPWAAAPGIEH